MYGTYDKGIEALFQGYYDTVNDLVKRFNNLVVDNARIKNVNVDKLYATDTKIKTALIEDLVVGENVLMGENASIVWGQIEDPPHIPEHPEDIGALPDTWRPSYGDIVGAKPPIDANNTYSELLYNSNIRGFVNQGGVLYISADYIRAGTITGDRIYGGTIRGVSILSQSGTNPSYTTDLGFGSLSLESRGAGHPSFTHRTLYRYDRIQYSSYEYDPFLISADYGLKLNGGNVGTIIEGNLQVTGNIMGSFSVSWSNVTGKPSTFPPSAHNHHGTYCQILGNYDIWFEITNSGAINVYRNGSYFKTL